MRPRNQRSPSTVSGSITRSSSMVKKAPVKSTRGDVRTARVSATLEITATDHERA